MFHFFLQLGFLVWFVIIFGIGFIAGRVTK